ncbi:VanZ family protein [Nocardioides ultimimeridianus]
MDDFWLHIELGLRDQPLLLPVTLAWFATVALLAACLAALHRSLRAPTFLYLLSLGTFLAVTLTPTDASSSGHFCQMALSVPTNERTPGLLNVGLGILLGATVGALKDRRDAVLLTLLIPILAEGFQYFVPSLGRTCSAVDAVANETGIFLGFAVVSGTRLMLFGLERARNCRRSGSTRPSRW